MVVAKNKKALVILVIGVAGALVVAGILTPPEYGQFVGLLWLPWLALLAWLAWSLIAPVVFTAEMVAPPEAVTGAFDKFEAALDNLAADQGELRINLQTATVLQETLIDLVVGFLDEAKDLADRLNGLSADRLRVADPKLAYLLDNLDGPEQSRVIASEIGNLQAQQRSYQMQAHALLGRVVEARGRIAQQQLKLRTTEAAMPLLEMNEALGKCQMTLGEFNARLPEPRGMRRRLLQ